MLHYSIDSLKLRIPLHKVEILESRLQGAWMHQYCNVETGEIIEDNQSFKNLAYSVEDKGIKTKYVCQKISNGRTTEPFLCILFNSKLLKDRYLEGITLENIRIVYDEIIKQKAIKVDYEEFLNGRCTDIDFKADREIKSLKQMEDIIQELDRLTKNSKDREKGNRIFRQRANYGIEWCKRQFSSNDSPFFKVYHKSIELKNNSSEFFNEHIKNIPENLIRIEWTLKNKKHAESFKYFKNGKKGFMMFLHESMTLQSLIEIENSFKYNMAIQVFGKHLEGIPKMNTDKNQKLNAIDQFIYRALQKYKSLGCSLYETVQDLTQDMTKQNRYKYSKKIESLWSLGMDEEKYNTDYETYDFISELTGLKAE
jgi:hypothetical protein